MIQDIYDLITEYALGKKYEIWDNGILLERGRKLSKNKFNYIRRKWHYNGTLTMLELYKDGILHGKRIKWFRNGIMWSLEHYNEGERTFMQTWYVNGIPNQIWDYNKHTRTKWSKNGKQKQTFMYFRSKQEKEEYYRQNPMEYYRHYGYVGPN